MVKRLSKTGLTAITGGMKGTATVKTGEGLGFVTGPGGTFSTAVLAGFGAGALVGGGTVTKDPLSTEALSRFACRELH